MKKKSVLALVLMIISALNAMAQTEMADTLRANGKIYVVVVVLATIFAGIFAFLFIIDRKISKLEKE